MKIAYICADLGIPVLGNKGASVHVREFTAALLGLGHEVRIYSAAGAARHAQDAHQNTTRASLTVLAPSRETRVAAASFATSLQRLGWKHDPTHLFSEVQHLLADPAFVSAALPLLQDFAPDLLIARHALFSLAGPELARALGCPCVLEVNAPLVEERCRYWGLTLQQEAEQAERTAFAGADLLVAVSEEVRNYLLRYDVPIDHITVQPNGVNLAHFHPGVDGAVVRRRYGLEGQIVLGFTGSLKPWHGVDMLLRAFASVRAALQQCESGKETALHLLIVGDGPQREVLMRLSQELGVSAEVTFTGALPHAGIPAHLAAFDIAVAPYLPGDSFYFSPLKVMEYLAMGRATAAPMLGQIPALLQSVDGPCGLLYRAGDQQALAEALLQLISDEELRRVLGIRAAEQAQQHYSWQRVARHIIAQACALPTVHRSQKQHLSQVVQT